MNGFVVHECHYCFMLLAETMSFSGTGLMLAGPRELEMMDDRTHWKESILKKDQYERVLSNSFAHSNVIMVQDWNGNSGYPAGPRPALSKAKLG
ncbi:hypothetical protein AC578_3402 [Pseudocercospora eumusae]|uniref:Uncharacterized protein n=1 Tax=Pseudocercospora eumusae TaxID=321146 RepID=A0A139H661_9PEZI|nr:hypothetical protein AC578_3402 [Pseudocercospora eumusae]KXS97938.1 hypothetical protein AC578_3402 [Pseudocercospora eumusae]